jgi:PAS domain S-box-containing protein
LPSREEDLAKLGEASHDAMVCTSLSGTVTSWNAGAEAMYGYSLGEASGRHVEMLIPDSRRAESRWVDEQVRAGERVEALETDRRGRDGRIIRVSVTAWPVTDDSGTIVGAAELARDISELERARLHFRRVFEAAPSAMLLVGPDGTIVRANPTAATYFGYSQDELAGTAIDALVPCRVRAHHARLRQAYVAAPTTRPMGEGRDLFARRRDGTEFPVEVALTPIVDSDDVQVLASVVDITRRKAVEQNLVDLNASLEQRVADRTADLERANHELEAFAYSVSHDLRAPLRYIDGYVRLLAEDAGPRLLPGDHRTLDVVAGAVREMGRLIDDLLEFSRMGRCELSQDEVDMERIVDDVWDRLRSREPARDVEWTRGALPAAAGDRAMLGLVWENLLSNALKYAKSGTPAAITVTGEQAGHHNEYGVKDNGIGFEPRHAEQIFGVFERLHAASEYEGTGIGLANVRRIVERHGGRVWAEGRSGEGAVFRFALPRSPGEGDP